MESHGRCMYRCLLFTSQRLEGGNADWPDKCTHHQHAAIIYIYNIYVGILCESTVQYTYYMCGNHWLYMCIYTHPASHTTQQHACLHVHIYTQQGSCMG